LPPPCPDLSLAAELVGAGYRALARQHHPDAGGSHHAFLHLGEVRAWFQGLILDGAASSERVA